MVTKMEKEWRIDKKNVVSRQTPVTRECLSISVCVCVSPEKIKKIDLYAMIPLLKMWLSKLFQEVGIQIVLPFTYLMCKCIYTHIYIYNIYTVLKKTKWWFKSGSKGSWNCPHLYFALGVKKTPVIHSPSLQAGPVGAWCVFKPGNHKDPTIWLKRRFIQKTTGLSGQNCRTLQ